MNSLKTCHWNANGLGQRALELEHFLNEHNIDIMMLSETHLTEKNNFKISGYNFYDTKHPGGKARGGTGILIKVRIKHCPLEEYAKEFLQATSVCIENFNDKFVVSAVYCPPRFSVSTTQFNEFFQSLGNKFLATGDYNAKHTIWGSRLISPKGRQLRNSLSIGLDFVSTGKPTYWPSDPRKTPDLIDFGITKGFKKDQLISEPCFELSSDHSPVIITIFVSGLLQTSQLTTKTTDWQKYKNYVDEHLPGAVPLKCAEDIESAIVRFNKTLTDAKTYATHKTKLSNQITAIFPSDLSALVIEKRRLRREWQKHRSPHLKNKLNCASRDLHKKLEALKELSINNYLKNLGPNESNEYSLWKCAKNLQRPVLKDSPIRKPDGSWARSDSEKGEALANYLKEVFKPYPGDPHDKPPNIAMVPEKPLKLKLSQVIQAIARINTKKAIGSDRISGEMVKSLAPAAVIHLTQIFNGVLRLGYFPNAWKISEVITVVKPGKDPSSASSYRPISLLSTISKLFEKLFLNKLRPYLTENNIIPDHQFGFQQNHGTTEQVHRLAASILTSLDNKEYCSALFLDVAQAFDKVWHEGLIYKIKTSLPACTHDLLNSYLTERKFYLKHKTYSSKLYNIQAGVPQGSVLGPLLYLLFTADLPTNSFLTTSTFADDTAILSSHKDPVAASQNLQTHLYRIEQWLKNWRIKVNASKSCHVTFTLNRSSCPPVKLNGDLIPQTNSVKYLGVHLDKRLTWRPHIEAKKQHIKIKLIKLAWLLKNKNLSLECKVLIYKAVIRPIWTYGIQLWGSASASSIDVIQKVQNRVLKSITGAPWYFKTINLHKDLEIPLVKHVIATNLESYKLKLTMHPNHLARGLLKSKKISRIKRKNLIE